ncbi:MAG: Spx/MgsR family RNA polymerase-binding regulatory protein [Bdellovibrionales bacterium]|nr:Spx/MgsR family RNA polymerase-binding regulatory protein [Bdellovibrionales bacterium]
MPLKIYQYPKCDTCRRALKFLAARKVDFTSVDVTEQPPSLAELKAMLKAQSGELRKLFNTSGQVYRELQIGAKLPQMSEAEALALLARHGKLVKRPFLLLHGGAGLLGFKEPEWKAAF